MQYFIGRLCRDVESRSVKLQGKTDETKVLCSQEVDVFVAIENEIPDIVQL